MQNVKQKSVNALRTSVAYTYVLNFASCVEYENLRWPYDLKRPGRSENADFLGFSGERCWNGWADRAVLGIGLHTQKLYCIRRFGSPK